MKQLNTIPLPVKVAALIAMARDLPDHLQTFRCEACEDTGFVDVGNRSVARCHCRRRAWDAEGVPAEFRSATFDTYTADHGNRAALERARAFLSGTRDLMLIGSVGVGKTRLACAIANEFVRTTGPAFFVRVAAMLHALQPRVGSDLGMDERRLVATPLLVLDDLGAERDHASDFTRRTLLWLYEQRSDEGLRTIWTSNKSLDEIAVMHDDDRLASRLAGRCDVVLLRGSDKRLPQPRLVTA